MTTPHVSLRHVNRDDVANIQAWLADDEVSESWFGRYSYGNPAHLGYHPEEALEIPAEEWNKLFENPEHVMRSIYNSSNEHIGEIHIAIEESLGDGQISILIGRKDMWHLGFGSATMKVTLELAFSALSLQRVWADIPEYNKSARTMFEHLGFTHEGTLRQSRPHAGARFDSVIMGMLATEYLPLRR